MKSRNAEVRYDADRSHPSRGAWIEILTLVVSSLLKVKSHPSRGAWIEMPYALRPTPYANVAPLTGCVD